MRREPTPNIYSYDSYREFLRDWIDYLQESGSIQSLRALARSANFSAGYLPGVLSGAIPLSEKALNKLRTPLRLGKRRFEYLILLRRVAESRNTTIREDAFKEIQTILQKQKIQPEGLKSFRYMNDWYHVAIREMVGLKDFKMDPQWIQSRLMADVSIRQIKVSLKQLVEDGFIDLSGKRPKLADAPIITESDFFKVSLKKFYEGMLEIEKGAIEKVPREQRKTLGYTIAIDPTELEKIKGIMQKALEDIVDVTKTSKKDAKSVYHFSLRAFPLVNSPDTPSEGANHE